MRIESNLEDGRLTIAVRGNFDFDVHKMFREAYQNIDEEPTVYVVDLRDAEHIDSSGLGLLLLLRDHCGEDISEINIINANPGVVKILSGAGFPQLFSIN